MTDDKKRSPARAEGEAGDGQKQRPGERYRNGQREKFG